MPIVSPPLWCRPHAISMGQSDVLHGSKAPHAGGEMAQYGHWQPRQPSVVSGAETQLHNTTNCTPACSSPRPSSKGIRVAGKFFGVRVFLRLFFLSLDLLSPLLLAAQGQTQRLKTSAFRLHWGPLAEVKRLHCFYILPILLSHSVSSSSFSLSLPCDLC